MAIKSSSKKSMAELKKLSFLVGKWHTRGEVTLGASDSSKEIRGMDTYEWVSAGCFILHRVDVFMGRKRTEAIEIIGYEDVSKAYFMQSFDSDGASLKMYAVLDKKGVLKFGDDKMRSVLRMHKDGNSMSAKWELSEDGKRWKPWMKIRFDR